jgi:hypothetical protein
MRRLYRKGGRETWANGKKNREKIPILWAEAQMNPTAIESLTGDAERKAERPTGDRRAWIDGCLRHLDLAVADPSGDEVVEGGADQPDHASDRLEDRGGEDEADAHPGKPPALARGKMGADHARWMVARRGPNPHQSPFPE